MDTDNLNISFSSCPQSYNFQREFYFKGNIKLKRQGMMTNQNHNFELSGISKVQVEIFFLQFKANNVQCHKESTI